MTFLYKLLKQEPDSRDGAVVVTSFLGIVTNVIIALFKIIIGVLANSVAILSEGANNATDALTSVISLVGAKLANLHPNKEHPFGYGRIEYLTSLIISILILFTGFEFIKSSITNIITPVELEVSYLSLAVVGISAIIKLFLGLYTIKVGNKVNSSSLVGVGLECRNDSIASAITIISALVFLIFKLNIDGYAGVITSLLILKAGYDCLKETAGDLLGRAGDKELATKMYKEIRSCDIVVNAADMMLHNYGPDRYSGSCNVEIDHNKTVSEVYAKLHQLQLDIMHNYNVVMVFGIYAVDRSSDQSIKLRNYIASYVREKQHVNSYHALFISDLEKKIYVDLIVDYELKDWDSLREEFIDYLNKDYSNYEIELTIETDFV